MKFTTKGITTKTFKKEGKGKWVQNPNRTEVLLCACGGKYIKTRKYQTHCLKCIYKIANGLALS